MEDSSETNVETIDYPDCSFRAFGRKSCDSSIAMTAFICTLIAFATSIGITLICLPCAIARASTMKWFWIIFI